MLHTPCSSFAAAGSSAVPGDAAPAAFQAITAIRLSHISGDESPDVFVPPVVEMSECQLHDAVALKRFVRTARREKREYAEGMQQTVTHGIKRFKASNAVGPRNRACVAVRAFTPPSSSMGEKICVRRRIKGIRELICRHGICIY